jgi:hypothetical protein
MKHNHFSQIREWDWHYRVGFDTQLAENIHTSLVSAKGYEQSAKDRAELLAYRDLVSVDSLVSELIKSPGKADEFIDASKKKTLLHLPEECSGRLLIRLQNAEGINQSIASAVKELVKAAEHAEFVNHSASLLELVLGPGFLAKAREHLRISQLSEPSAAKQLVLTSEISAQSLMQKYSNEIIDFGLTLMPIDALQRPIWSSRQSDEMCCFAEYWPSMITGSQNELVLGLKLLESDYSDVVGTLVHEIAGHACFYELASTGYFSFVDQGAICLIEGWATWCEWSSPFADNEYRKKIKRIASKGLGLAEVSNGDDARDRIHMLVCASGFNGESFDQALLSFFQYPGYSPSYFAGAAWFDIELQGKSASSFWQSRRGRAITNVL